MEILLWPAVVPGVMVNAKSTGVESPPIALLIGEEIAVVTIEKALVTSPLTVGEAGVTVPAPATTAPAFGIVNEYVALRAVVPTSILNTGTLSDSAVIGVIVAGLRVSPLILNAEPLLEVDTPVIMGLSVKVIVLSPFVRLPPAVASPIAIRVLLGELDFPANKTALLLPAL